MNQRIVWPVDLFTDSDSLQRTTAKCLQILARAGKDVEIQPIYLYGSYAIDSAARGREKIGTHFYTSAEKKLRALLKGISLPGLLPLKMMGLPYPTLRENTEEVLGFARKWKADLVIVGTHSRHGTRRLLMGSFAETLSLHSEIPLFVVNPRQKNPAISDILFPTDFSAASRDILSSVMAWAILWRSSITLFHRVNLESNPGIESAFGTYGVYHDFFKQNLEVARKEGKRWLERMKAKNIPARLMIDQSPRGTVAQSILRAARKTCGIIAITGQSGAISSLILGSISRQILRESPIPVWIVHYSAKLRQKRKKLPVPATSKRRQNANHAVQSAAVHRAHLN